MPVHLTCPVCGSVFPQKPSLLHRIHCSASCGQQARFAPLPIEIDGDVARIPLQGRDGTIKGFALIDTADAVWAGQWRWSLDNHGYAVRRERDTPERRTVLLHRAILGLTYGDPMTGDHLNGNRLDDRRTNLRIIPLEAQAQNRLSHRGSSSRFRGVALHKQTGKWAAYICVNYKQTNLGLFTSEEEAAQVAHDARLRLHTYATD